jgi:hypothetical protein
LDIGLRFSSGQVCEETDVSSGMVSLQEVTKFGGHLLVSVINFDIGALCIDSEELIVGGFMADAHADRVTLITQDILVDPLLPFKVFSDIPVNITRSGVGIRASRAGQEMMQRLV